MRPRGRCTRISRCTLNCLFPRGRGEECRDAVPRRTKSFSTRIKRVLVLLRLKVKFEIFDSTVPVCLCESVLSIAVQSMLAVIEKHDVLRRRSLLRSFRVYSCSEGLQVLQKSLCNFCSLSCMNHVQFSNRNFLIPVFHD